MSTSVSKTNFDTIVKNIQKYSPYPSQVKIIAVTKGFSVQAIRSAISNKIYDVGENRVQEFFNKTEKLKTQKIHSHLIGHLQTNKIKKAAQIFNTIQTIDSLKLATKLNEHLININKKKHIFIQINVGNDSNKFGFSPNNVFSKIEKIEKMNNLIIGGTMTILPYLDNISKTEKLFAKMRTISHKIKTNISPTCSSISMGMSRDYIYALKQGSTHLRIGTLLYGAR
jgi:pyridoxal phosphate enzyme (YggS family)